MSVYPLTIVGEHPLLNVPRVSTTSPLPEKLKCIKPQRKKLRSLQGLTPLLAPRVTPLPLLGGSNLGEIGALNTLQSIVVALPLSIEVIHLIRQCISAPGIEVPILHTSTRLLPQAY